tara:strand:- start:90 stop:338 length:249 start_codon:yes stop_codon:yes gene_type:complete
MIEAIEKTNQFGEVGLVELRNKYQTKEQYLLYRRVFQIVGNAVVWRPYDEWVKFGNWARSYGWHGKAGFIHIKEDDCHYIAG